MSCQVDSLPGFGFLDGPVSMVWQQRSTNPLGWWGSSLGRLFSRWSLKFSLSLRKNRERREKTLYSINWLVCVSILTWLLPKTLPSLSPKWDTWGQNVSKTVLKYHLFTTHLNIDDILSGSAQSLFNWKSILLASFAKNRKVTTTHWFCRLEVIFFLTEKLSTWNLETWTSILTFTFWVKCISTYT